MNRFLLLSLLLLFPAAARSQDGGADYEDFMRSAEQWAKENLDDSVLQVFKEVDQDQVKKFFLDFQKKFRSQYVIDTAGLKNAANLVLPLLESYEETEPFAVWLKSRLDYLDVADDWRRNHPALKAKNGARPSPAANPGVQAEREIWIKKVAQRPWPPAAKEYLAQLKPIFAEQRVPAELVWLAEVESSFDPRARSPVGAAGLFQLMPATAKRFGLRSWPLDERYRPEPSARAAAKYLNYLHAKFKDWRLALAAYNLGEGSLENLLTKHKVHSFDAIATHLPAETQMYVPRIEATLLKREGVSLAEL